MRALLVSLILLFAGPLLAAETPSQIVEQRSKSVLAELNAKRKEFRADPAKLHAYVHGELQQIFDRGYSAQLVLGRHARAAKQEQIIAFADALTENLLKRYGNALLDVDPGIEIKVKSETKLREKIVRVATEIQRRAGAPVPVDYLFREGPNGWKVFDVIVEGVSYVQTYRNQFDERLRGESLEQLTAELAAGTIRAGS